MYFHANSSVELPLRLVSKLLFKQKWEWSGDNVAKLTELYEQNVILYKAELQTTRTVARKLFVGHCKTAEHTRQ